MSRPLPTPSLIVLVGAPASGKSTWAEKNFRPEQIISSDQLRGVVGEHELDLAATDDVFDLLDRIVEMRLGRGLTTVIDTTGLDGTRRRSYIERALSKNVHPIAVRFTTTATECRRRNRQRRHPVPSKALETMLKAARAVELSDEGWDLVLEPEPVRMVTAKLHSAASADHDESGLDRSDRTGSDSEGRAANLRFGLLVSSFDWPGGAEAIGPQLSRIARDAEEAGFDSLWVMDHMIQIPQVGRAWDPMLDSYTTLGFLASATRTIRLGVLVSAVTFRNIGHLGKMIATLDVLSGGRAIAGLGAGNSEREHDAYEWAFPAAPARLAMLEDALQALPLLWGPGNPSFVGKTLSIPDTTSYPRPLQDPLPIIVGGSGEQVTLRLAARYASGCNLFGDAASVARKVEVLHRHCGDVGRDPTEIEVTHLGELLLGLDSAHVSDQIERFRPPNVGPDRYASSVNAGTIDDHEAGFRHMADAGVQTAIVSTPNVADPATFPAFAELINRFRSS